MTHAIELAAGSANQDRAAAIPISDNLLTVLADGAGGTGNGALAAQTIVDRALASTDPDWVSFLLERDPARGVPGHRDLSRR